MTQIYASTPIQEWSEIECEGVIDSLIFDKPYPENFDFGHNSNVFYDLDLAASLEE